MNLELVKEIIDISCYIVLLCGPFILGVWGLLRFKNGVKSIFSKGLWSVCLSLYLLFAWSFALERQLLITNYHTISSEQVSDVRFAVFADIHIGRYKGRRWVEKVASKLNTLDVDFIVVPGDWTYGVGRDELETVFEPLGTITKPVYATLGNHDLGFPGTGYGDELISVLERNNIQLIDEKTQNIFIRSQKISVHGIPDTWASNDDVSVLENLSNDAVNIAIAHNPDATRSYSTIPNTAGEAELLTVAGHTHCGQVRLPFVYPYAIPVIDNYFDAGWYAYNSEQSDVYSFTSISSSENTNLEIPQLFITCGVGEVGLPFRFLNPPAIDVITII